MTNYFSWEILRITLYAAVSLSSSIIGTSTPTTPSNMPSRSWAIQIKQHFISTLRHSKKLLHIFEISHDITHSAEKTYHIPNFYTLSHLKNNRDVTAYSRRKMLVADVCDLFVFPTCSKMNPGFTHNRCILQHLYLGVLAYITGVLEVRQSISNIRVSHTCKGLNIQYNPGNCAQLQHL